MKPLANSRADLAANIRRSIKRLPAGHYGHARARQTLDLLESDMPIAPQRMTTIRLNVDWYVDYLERVTTHKGILI